MSEDLQVLRALVGEIRTRLSPGLSLREIDDLGIWMWKAYRLGKGDPAHEVLKAERSTLTVVGKD